MDKITDAKTEFRIKQWTKIIQTCRSSGMTVVVWCEQHDIKIKSYYYWLRRLRSMLCQSDTLPVISQHQPIVPLSLKPDNTLKASAAITIHMPDAYIDIHNGASTETIEVVLVALKATC